VTNKNKNTPVVRFQGKNTLTFTREGFGPTMTEAVQMGDAAVARSLAADAGAGNKTVTLYRGVALKAFGLYKYGNVDNIFGQYFWNFSVLYESHPRRICITC